MGETHVLLRTARFDWEHQKISPSLNIPRQEGETRVSPTADSAEHRWFAGLVDAHGAAILALLRRLCRNPHDAEDVFQETAVRVWRFRATQRPRNTRAWLMTIAYRAFLDHRARQSEHSKSIFPAPDCNIEGPPDHRFRPPIQCLEQDETIRMMNAVLLKLPEAERAVIALHYTGGMSLSETAEAMGVSSGTVKSRLNSALNHLRSKMR